MGCVGPQGAAKQVMEIVDVFELFFNRELIDKIVERPIDMPSSFYWSVNFRQVNC
jgi:hypothetical protein